MSTATGYSLTDETQDKLLTRMERADAWDVNGKMTGMVILRSLGVLLGVLFLAVNAYQATWALMKLSGMGDIGNLYEGGPSGLTADQWVVGATAFGLVLAAQVIGVRMAMSEGVTKAAGVTLLTGLMTFSVVTSAMHIAFKVEGGVVASTQASDDYKLAKARYEAALASLKTSEQNWTNYQKDVRGGDPWSLNATHSKGPARPYVESIKGAKSEIDSARIAYNEVKESGGGAEATVVTTMASALGMTSAQFALWFSLFAVVLMELVRVYLSFLTGAYLMEAMAEARARRRKKAVAEGGAADVGGEKPQAQPAQRSKVMAASAPEATDTIRGPALRDPIEVDDEPKPKPKPLFAPRKPSPEPKIQTTEQAPERKKSAKDRAPGNKRSAKFSQQLSTLKAAIGSTFPIGQRMNVEDMKRMVNCNSETATRLRNALAESGVAHWQGRSLFAGKAPE